MIQINTDLCIGCGSCVFDCVSNNIELVPDKSEERQVASIKGNCFLCGHCVAICPAAAVANPYYQEPLETYNADTFDIPTENMVNAIKFRRSIRHYADKLITPDQWRTLLIGAGAHTATAVNRQQNRFYVIQEQLGDFKDLIWEAIRSGHPLSIDEATRERFIAMKDGNPSVDYIFRNAPAVLCIEAPDPVDGGLAAGAIEMTATTMGLGVLYNGYLRYLIESIPAANEFIDRDGEKPLIACMLIGYPDERLDYRRTAPRRRPSIVLR